MRASEGLRQMLEGERIGGVAAARMQAYLALLEKWNARINLTASTEWASLAPLFGEGIWASGLYGRSGGLHLDIGSGGGFPALPLAILNGAVTFELVESRARRAVFLEAAPRVRGLTHVRVIGARLDGYLRDAPAAGGWNCISWKGLRLATADLKALLTRARAGCDLWLFHAGDLPVEDTAYWEEAARLLRRAEFPGRKGWFLSVFRARVSRETSTL